MVGTAEKPGTSGLPSKPTDEENILVTESKSILSSATGATGADSVMQLSPGNEHLSVKTLVCKDVWSDDMSTVEEALKKLADLCTEDKEDNRMEIIRAGGHLAIIKAMEKNLLSSTIQAEGCRALQNLTVKIGSEEDEGRQEEVAEDSTNATSSAKTMLGRLSACGVLEAAGCVNLKTFGLVSVNEDNLSRIVDAGGIVVIVAAMKTHPREPRLQALACGALYNLSCQEGYKKSLEEDGVMGALANSIENHKDVAYIQTWGRATLRRLAAE